MHRLFTIVTAVSVIAAGLFISQSASTRPLETRELHIKASPSDAKRRAEPVSRTELARMTTIQWKPGLVSTNVNIRPRRLKGFNSRGNTSARKGGTEDINIGVGELQECTISKSMDRASPLLARLAKSRTRLPQIVLRGRDRQGKTLLIKMKNVFITSYQTGGSSDSSVRRETVTINYTGLE